MGLDGGVMVTASHNPKSDYNGMKFVREQARPISSGHRAGKEIEQIARWLTSGESGKAGRGRQVDDGIDLREAYVEHLLGYVDRVGAEAR